MKILKEDGWFNKNKHWLVLVACVVFSFLAWVFWIKVGVYWVHDEVQNRSLSILGKVASKEPQKDIGINQLTEFLTGSGQIGDSFGGLNSLLTAVAGALVAWAGYMQHLTLSQARTEAKEERMHRQRLEFETLFFQLLQLSSQATERFQRKNEKKGIEHCGARAIDSYAHLVYNKFRGGLIKQDKALALSDLVCEFLRRAYDRKPSTFGPYYRLLFQTFKHIADSDLPDEEKIRYSNIARGQISEGAVLLLALNGLTKEGRKFAPLIEKFGLLEHLHRKHQADKQMLMCGYRPRAFMGSEERAKPENRWQPSALELPVSHFEAIDACRADSDADDDLNSGYDPTTLPEDE